MSSLPALPPSNLPTRFPQSCASLSLPLLALLHKALPPPPSISLSIGSGPGLLEALFLQQYPSRCTTFFGVEVTTPEGRAKVNRFLNEERVVEVRGTWAKVEFGELEERVGEEKVEVKGLVFCYPRQVGLVKEYLKMQGVEVIVWIGPRCDEESFGGIFEAWGEKEEVNGVVEDGEIVVVYRRR